jgi:crotonobetainyl-CoA:carnitine CoA-transferase CaiB-like acyl-CoA transferase
MVCEALQKRTTAEWEHRLLAADIPHAPVLSVGQALRQPQIVARGLVQSMPHPRLGGVEVVGSPIRMSGAAPVPAEPAPLLGEHTRSVLSDVLGMTDDEIDALHSDGVLGIGETWTRA